MARVLIVGCGCRGRALAARLAGRGYHVRGTSRRDDSLGALEAAGVEPVLADPLRLATVMPAIEGASAACWLMGSATGPHEERAALHDTRLASMLDLLVDTHVRGFVYEAAGTVEAELLEHGSRVVERASEQGIRTACVRVAPAAHAQWLDATAAAAEAVHLTG